MSRLSFLSLCGLAAFLMACGSADAGLRHRHGVEPGCGCEPSCVEPGCSAFEPACAMEPACCAAEPGCGAAPCCPTQPCIKYPTSPETCCTVAVPVCLPACCQGCPCESSRCTLFGCGQVRYDYACGCSVIVRFQKSGDILVIYEGF